MLVHSVNIVMIGEKKISNKIKLLQSMGSEIKHGIIARTQSGKDIHGSPFEGYSRQYKNRKAKLGKDTSPVNLTLHNEMLNGMRWKNIKGGLRFYFVGGARTRGISNATKAYYLNNGIGKNKKREFFGLDNNQIQHIVKRLSK